MTAPYGWASWPGVVQFESAVVNFAPGISPATCSLTIAPQLTGVAEYGDFSIGFGSRTITLRDCKVDWAASNLNKEGAIVSLQILDRRWKWAFGHISGVYNRRDAEGLIDDGDGEAIDDTEKTPRELAKLLLDAMGEKGANVEELPNETRPLVEWDYANPAQELDSLCQKLGCFITLDPEKGNVVIRRIGKGAQLPNGPVMADKITFDPPEVPDEFMVVCGVTKHQADFALEAVALEADGSLVPLDEASYKPASGWATADIYDFTDIDNTAHRELARQSVYRFYRVKTPLKLPGHKEEIKRLDMILPISGEQVETATIAGRKRAKPAIVYGKWYKGDDVVENVVDTVTAYSGAGDPQLVTRSWTLDGDIGVVKFSEPMYALDADNNIVAAELRLRASCGVRERKTRGWKRYERTKKGAKTKRKTKAKALKHDEIALAYYPEYDNSFGVVKTHDNKKDVDREADDYLKAAVEGLVVGDQASRTYGGLVLPKLDGALQSATVTIDGNGCITTVHRNHDPGSPVSLPLRVRQELEANKKAREINQLFGPDALKRAAKNAGL